MMPILAYLDFEASGLAAGSWPIEVGWARQGGPVRSLLIRPAAGWTDDLWDCEAEAVHGIARDALDREGRTAEAVCRELEADLKGCLVLSDAPEFDGTWLGTLYQAVGRTPSFSLFGLFDYLHQTFGGPRTMSALERARAQVPPTHRAAADVRHIMAIHAFCLAEADTAES